jgi:HSP20 family molecular chaperone IbpA
MTDNRITRNVFNDDRFALASPGRDAFRALFGRDAFASVFPEIAAPFGIKERSTQDGCEYEFMVAGVPKDKIHITVPTQGLLEVEAHDDDRSYNYRQNVPYGYDLDNATASLNDGVLVVKVPSTTDKEVRTISIE